LRISPESIAPCRRKDRYSETDDLYWRRAICVGAVLRDPPIFEVEIRNFLEAELLTAA